MDLRKSHNLPEEDLTPEQFESLKEILTDEEYAEYERMLFMENKKTPEA